MKCPCSAAFSIVAFAKANDALKKRKVTSYPTHTNPRTFPLNSASLSRWRRRLQKRGSRKNSPGYLATRARLRNCQTRKFQKCYSRYHGDAQKHPLLKRIASSIKKTSNTFEKVKKRTEKTAHLPGKSRKKIKAKFIACIRGKQIAYSAPH